MTNPNIQGPIPLDGVGYVAKLKRNYQSGEYRRLSNVEIEDGIIKNRTNIAAAHNPGQTLTPITNPFPFVGFIGDYVIVASKTSHYATDGLLGYTTLWNPSGLTVPAAAGSYHKIVGAFLYNKLNCWLTHEYDAATGMNTIYLHTIAENVLTGLGAVTYAAMTHTVAVTDDSWDFVYDNFFIQGERLWIVTSKGVFFSKPTDHTVWAVPDGGFFKFQGQTINYATYNKEIIYVLCDNAVFSIAYNTDPNEDSVARQLSEVTGGDHACIHLDTPYFINATGVYAINSNGVEKVMDSAFDIGSSSYTHKLTSFEDYLIVNRYNSISYESSAAFNSQYFADIGREFTEAEGFNLMGYNVFFLNTKSGAMHVLDFKDAYDAAYPGYITDVIVNTNKDFFRNHKVFFMTNRYVSLVGSNYTYKGNVYSMSIDSNNPFIYDTVCNDVGVVKRHLPKVDIEIDSFTPDGNEYLMKKFRSIEIMGDFPNTDFYINFAWDNLDYPAEATPLAVSNTVLEAAGEPRTHYPCRVGLNQRARSISVRLTSDNWDTQQTNAYTWNHLQISDIRVLWSYTKAGVNIKTPTTTS